MLLPKQMPGIRVALKLQVKGRDPEVHQGKNGIENTVIYKFRACDTDIRNPCLWELWFEYPSESGEDPKLANDTIVYVLGILESHGTLESHELGCKIQVNEYYTSYNDFDEASVRWLADYANLVISIDKIRRKNEVFEPRKPLPYGETAAPAKQVQAPAKAEAPSPAAAPAPPQPVTGDTGPQSDVILDPKPGEKVDASFDPEKLVKPDTHPSVPNEAPMKPGGESVWPGNVSAWRFNDGSAQAAG